jgi:hypothetical protein
MNNAPGVSLVCEREQSRRCAHENRSLRSEHPIRAGDLVGI